MDIQQFGATIKTKYPQYKNYSDEEIGTRMLQKYPQYKDKVQEKRTLQGFGQNIVKGAVDTGKGLLNIGGLLLKASPLNPNFQQNQQAQRDVIKTAIQIPGQIAGDIGAFAQDPVGFTYKNPLDVATSVLPGVGVGAKLGLKGGKLAAKAAKYTTRGGKILEETAAAAGPVSSEALLKHFGTPSMVKLGMPGSKTEQLLKGVTTASTTDKRAFMQKLNDEISGLNSNPQTYSNILEYRKRAGENAYPAKGQPSTPEHAYNQNLQRTYSNMLKEGAGTAEIDKWLSKIANVKKTLKNPFTYGTAGGLIGYMLLQRLMNKIIPSGSE